MNWDVLMPCCCLEFRVVPHLGRTVDREKAAIGVFLTLGPLSRDMNTEVTTAGFYRSTGWNKDFPKIQIPTVEQLLAGKKVQLPPSLHTFKQAEKLSSEGCDQRALDF
jgi:site-specific DNA-methyltransferase (adenine-specific)